MIFLYLSCAQAQVKKVAADELKQLLNQLKSHLFPQFSDTDQRCGTISTFQCLCFFTTTRRVCLIPSLGIPSHSPAVRGSGRIPEMLRKKQGQAGARLQVKEQLREECWEWDRIRMCCWAGGGSSGVE